MKAVEKRTAKKEKLLIEKSYSKATQSKLFKLVADILKNPRDKKAIGYPEELKYREKEMWSRELTKKDRIVYGIEPGVNYNMPKEPEIVVFYQYLGHYEDK